MALAGRERAAPLAHLQTRGVRDLPALALLAVAAAYVVAELALVGTHVRLGWDETVYVSQVSQHAPAAPFSAPRARGITLLAAPVTWFTDSLTVLRCYLIAVSAVGLVLAYRVWLPLRRTLAVPLAALLFATLWVSLFYGQEVMPNFFVALGAVAAVGFTLRAVVDPRRHWPLVGAALTVGWVALVRPTDGVWLAAPLALAVLAVRAWRRPAPLLALTAGLLIGWVPWLVEAYVRFGGPLARFHAASAQNRGGLTFSLLMQANTLDGPLLCKPCTNALPHPALLLWWLALPPLLVAGLVLARRAGALALAAVPTVVGLCLAVEYIFFVDYAAPRFLLPSYALLALPVAGGLVAVARVLAGRYGVAAVGVGLAVALAGHVAIQAVAAWRITDIQERERTAWAQVAAALPRHGVRPPCAVIGTTAYPIAFYAGCAVGGVLLIEDPEPNETLRADLGRIPVAAVVQGTLPPGSFLHGWRPVRVDTVTHRQPWRIYLPPSARSR